MLKNDKRQAAAKALAQAERDREPIPPLTETYPGIDVEDAYEIQLINVRDRVESGSRVLGHKVGLTARAMQQMMNVDEPDYGHLLDDMFAFEGSTISCDRFLAARVEPEVAFVLGAPLRGPGCTVADVLRATEFVVPAIEVIDTRITDWKIKLPDTIADNASSAMVVLGGSPTLLAEVDIRLLGVVLRRNGAIADTGATGAVLSNPATAVAWLANKVSAFGVSLEAGHVILPGSCTKAVDVHRGDTVRADFDVLGHVSVAFA